MGVVKYKLTITEYIDRDRLSLSIDYMPINLNEDYKGNYVYEGEISGASLMNEKLNVFIRSTGRVAQTFELEIKYDGKELKKFPIQGTIKPHGRLTINTNYTVKK